MKTLFNDPAGWSEKAVGSAPRFAFMLVGHAVGALLTVFMGWRVADAVARDISPGSAILGVALAAISFGFVWPVIYLYALRKLVLLHREGR